jgi:hypothetical protein
MHLDNPNNQPIHDSIFLEESATENACRKEIAAVSVEETAQGWQAKQIRSIVCSALHGVVVHALVQATGGGKSLVRDTAAFTFGGVNLTVSLLLVLGSD